MKKPIFYCDCDGVILNTIQIAFEIMREDGCNMADRNDIDFYFRSSIDWNKIFDRATVINHAIDRLRYMKNSDIFENVIILTKLSGGYHEEGLKRDLFRRLLPNIQVVTLQYGLNKGIVVPAKGNILLDDEIDNCRKWEQEDGTAILFSPYMNSPENNIISDLSELTHTKNVKKLLKTRNF